MSLPIFVTRLRKIALTFSQCCVLSPVPLIMHLIPSMSPMPSCQFPRSASITFLFPLFLFLLPFDLYFLVFLVLSLLFCPLSCFRFLFFPFISFILTIELRLSCACVVIGTTCNIYVVVFLGAKWWIFQARLLRRMHQYEPGTS